MFLLSSSHPTLSSMLIQEHLSSKLDDRKASKAVLYHLEIFVWKPHALPSSISFKNPTRQKRSWMKFERFDRTFCRNVGTFGANLCNLFPNLRIRHWKVGQETSKLGACMNRFYCKTKNPEVSWEPLLGLWWCDKQLGDRFYIPPPPPRA